MTMATSPDRRSLTIRFVRSDGIATDAVVDVGCSVFVGRDLTCELRLDGRRVSRRHLRLENRPDGVRVVADAGSHNGTFVNGNRITELGVVLHEGDVVHCGEWEGKVELRVPVAEPPRRASGPAMVPAFAVPAPSVVTSPPESVGATDPSRMRPWLHTPTLTSPSLVPQGVPAPGPFPGSTPVTPAYASGPAPAPPSTPRPAAPPTAPLSSTSTPRPTSIVLPANLRGAPPAAPQTAMPRTWNWDESQPTTGEQVRAARIDENPIVRRISETSTQLDFRGLSDLPQVDQPASSTAGMRAPAGSAIDAIALRLVFKVTETLSSTESMDDFLREMTEQLSQAARAKGVVVLLPGDDRQLAPRVVKTRRRDEKMQLSRTVIDYVVHNKAALTTEDAAADERFARGESVLRFDLKAVLCVPLLKHLPDGGAGDVLGVLYLTRDLPFTNTERDLVAALAHLIAMGLERTRLREEYAAAERTRRSLERFHAPDVVRRLMMDSSQGVHRDGLFLEPLTATVLFCDLAGFTTYCEAHEPEQVGMLLNSYLATMTETVFAHGGTVDKFIGDAVMCIFGAPFMAADDALRAVRCAAEMRRNFRALVSAGACGEDARALDVHIGVNTGKVVAGTVGSPRRMEYTALGDTVNTAARLEGVAKKGQIVVGPATAALVRDRFPLVSMGAVNLKGKGQQVEVFLVPEDA
ncbi:MAG: FHA domain-containing protein [Deltaproteobacteria bacterium]|nr:FHA domain-containing protein [Deltaproteobacteria bacterium]